MLGAAFFGVLAIMGASNNHLWTSHNAPREGARYRAVTWWGEGEFSCAGSIGGKPTLALNYRSPTHTVCILVIPAGTAGEKLQIGYSLETRLKSGAINHGHGLVRPKLIRR